MRGTIRQSAAACAAAIALLGLPAGAGAWGGAVASSTLPTSTPFAPWGDGNAYFYVPGGRFESGLGDWQTRAARRTSSRAAGSTARAARSAPPRYGSIRARARSRAPCA